MSARALRKFSIEDIFVIVNDALSPYYYDKTVTVQQEMEDGEEVNKDVPVMEFIMRAIAHEMADRWTSTKEEVLEPMHAALDPRDYEEFTYSIDQPVSLITYRTRGGGGKKSRKTRRRRN
jgi:hypothetical protein